MHLPNNTLLQGGKYKITRFIASGGFGCTYEGVHTMLDTKVAIKEFFPKMFCNRDENTSHVTVATQGNRDLVAKLRKKFNEEAIAVFRMKHDNIVRVLDVFEENGTAYYVMEYVDGKSLNEIVKERGALPEAEAVGYIRQVADALKYVHSLNRLHLDIKPGNIMVDKNGKAILIDFGASKHYDDESGENTSTLLGVNTKGYAPIEQSTQSFSSFSPATDIYAIGATLYKLLTGITPPDANLLVIEEEVLLPLNSDISEQIRYAIRKAMSLRRKDRPQSIVEFLSLLDTPNEEVLINDEATVLDVSLSSQRESDNIKRKIELAMRYYQVGDQSSYKLAIPLFTEAANYGEAEAQYYLGYCYHRGFGLEVDQQQAIKWFSSAAEQNHEWAIIMLSKCYANGIGVERDPEKAKELNMRIRKK